MPNLFSPGAARGNDPALVRQLGFFSATALVISNMVGMAIFTTTGYMAADLGSAGLILACWSVGALFALAGALSYSELGINFPSSGGNPAGSGYFLLGEIPPRPRLAAGTAP